MEPSVDTSLEDAIGWLVQIILGALLMNKLETWIRQFGLADNIDRLKSEIRRVGMLVAAVKGRAIGNEQLAETLSILKELLYDADDVVDDLDYYMLQQQVQGGNSVTRDEPEGMHGEDRVDEIAKGNADTPNSSVGKLWSGVWQHFRIKEIEGKKPVKAECRKCGSELSCRTDKNGTSSMKYHLKSQHNIKISKKKQGANPPNTSSTDDATANATSAVIDHPSSRKRRRTDEGAAQTTAANIRTPWDKAELSSRIQKITSQLHDTREEVNDFLKALGPDSVASSNHCRSTTPDQRLRTSSVVQRKMYGRSKEKEDIIKLMTEHKSGGLTVLPILGTAGVGKTALAQLVYNDPAVKSQFDHKIWVWVSSNFDETRLSTEILDIVPQETHKGFCSFAKSQEFLKNHIKSKRVLVVLDDVWDEVNDCWWNQLLAPYKHENANGNVILVTTRKLSVAKRIGTAGPIELGALEKNVFWQLFKSCAFADEYHEGHRSLTIIGQQIAKQLKGNSLAAVTAGALLRDDCTVDHWSNILKNKDWKSLEFIGGIMPAFKLSYDQLPYHLQQCFWYCSIFPYNHKFLDEELVHIWISQGFVKCNHSSQRLEDIGRCYLIDLVNLGFFQQVDKKESFVGSKSWYAICGLMHDFARMVSRTECATIDGLQYNKMSPNIRHLSIVTDSAYSKDQDGNITRNNDFEKNLRNTITSVRKLRTLVLVGKYPTNTLLFQLFQDIFQKAHHLRLLQISATSSDFNSLICSLVNPAHVRYLKRKLKRKFDEVGRALPQVLNKFYHLQVLDVGLNIDPTAPNCMDNLVSLRHLVAEERVHSSIARIGEMTSLQELKFSVQDSSGFEITQLQSMDELSQLQVSKLENVKTQEASCGAGLRNKLHLEKLHLSWSEYGNDPRSVFEGLEPHVDLKHLQISGYGGTTSPIWLAGNISVTSLHTLHLEDCGEWEILPSFERLPCLSKLKLSRIPKVIEVSVHSLEELILDDMPKLQRCSCTFVEALNSSLKALQIKKCDALEVFDLFEKYHRFEIEQKSWLPGLRKLIMSDCPRLKVLSPLPPSATLHELLISRVSTLPRMDGSSSQTLTIGLCSVAYLFDIGLHSVAYRFDKSSDDLRILDDKILAFHNLRSLKLMRIHGCKNLTFIWFKGFSQLVSLQSMEIDSCGEHFSWHVMPPGHTHEDMTAANWKAFPSLESVSIRSCGITAEWLSLMLRHAPVLKELDLQHCRLIKQLLIEEEEDSQSNLTSAHAATAGPPDVTLTGSAPVNELNFISSLKKIVIADCPYLTFNVGKKGLSRFTSLENLQISRCPQMLRSLVHEDINDDRVNGRWLLPQSLRELEICGDSSETLQPYFTWKTCLTKLYVSYMPSLKSLQVHSCTALEELEELKIEFCESLLALKGLQFLGSLKCLKIYRCPSLRPCLERLLIQGPELCPPLSRLKTLSIPHRSLLTTSLCKHLSSLQCLKLSDCNSETTRLTDEQELALQLLTSLQELEFVEFEKLVDVPAELNKLSSLKRLRLWRCNVVSKLTGIVLPMSLQELQLSCCEQLVDLPAELHSLPSLKKFQIRCCDGISSLPVTGLPHSLEKLEISGCSQELTEECRNLATRNLKVKINWEWIN